jgi:hypothetical protein
VTHDCLQQILLDLVALPRERRGDDGKVFFVTPRCEVCSRYSTKEFEIFAVTLMRETPVMRTCQIVSELATRMVRILFDPVKKGGMPG